MTYKQINQENNEWSKDLRRLIWGLGFLLVLGLLTILALAGVSTKLPILVIWGLACFSSGASIGFLFGIPKILQSEKPNGSNEPEISYRQQVNTNLEQISDWLTKIIVGLGLINLNHIPTYLNQIAEILTVSIGGIKENNAFALALIVYFSIIGFLFGYLFTRLFLAGAFFRADHSNTQAITVADNIQSIAREIKDPKLLQQFFSKVKPEALIEGESIGNKLDMNSSNESEKADADPNGKENLDQEFEKLQNNNQVN